MNPAYQWMLWAWVGVAIWVAFVIFTNRKVHPKVLFALFGVELWERFSYYGMRAFLVLFLMSSGDQGGFGIAEKSAYGVYAAYGALVYLTPILGGLLADRFLGFRKAIIWGAILMAAAQFTLASSTGSEVLLYGGLGLLTLGNGFFKPNISSMIGKFYQQGDPRRDGAFTIFYMGINLGALLAPLTCGAVAKIEGWHYGFLLAGCGMVLGLAFFFWTIWTGWLEDKADPPASARGLRVYSLPVEYAIYAGTFLVLPVAALLIRQNDVMDYLMISVGVVMISYMMWLSFQYPKVERERLWVVVILLLFTTVFWSFFELAGSALNVFTDRNVTKTLFGAEMPAPFFQGVNPAFIVLFAPFVSLLFLKLARRNIIIPAPVKFSIGLGLLGAGFLMLNLGKPFAQNGMMPLMFLILLYLLHTLGELVLSPVGLSLVTKLSPAKIVGFVMGFWFMSSAIAHQAGKWIAGETAADPNATPQQTLDLALGVFNKVGFFALGAAVLLLLLSPIIVRWMHGVENNEKAVQAEQEPPMTSVDNRSNG
jgi:POT family proton-dependent oligopeptide transporter